MFLGECLVAKFVFIFSQHRSAVTCLTRDVPFVQVGAGMEAFMIRTGFYDKCDPSLASTNPSLNILYKLSKSVSLDNCVLVPRRVTEIEAQRLEETREDREAFKRMLREEIQRQAQEKNLSVKLPNDE